MGDTEQIQLECEVEWVINKTDSIYCHNKIVESQSTRRIQKEQSLWDKNLGTQIQNIRVRTDTTWMWSWMGNWKDKKYIAISKWWTGRIQDKIKKNKVFGE